MGAPASVPDVWPRRVLRRLAASPRHSPLPRDAAPDHQGYDPPEGWGWCYVDRLMLDLGDNTTPHNGPIPNYL